MVKFVFEALALKHPSIFTYYTIIIIKYIIIHNFCFRPAHCGAFKGQLETLRLLAEHGANLWLRNSKGGYPLHDAVRSGRKELVLWLILMRPESADYYDDDGKRPLHIGALNNNLEMCKVRS